MISIESFDKTGRHDIAEILLKVALNTVNQSINHLRSPDCSQLLTCPVTTTKFLCTGRQPYCIMLSAQKTYLLSKKV